MPATAINERTTIPLWGILVAIPVLVSAILAFGFTAWETHSNAIAVEKLESAQDKLQESDRKQDRELLEVLAKIDQRLAIIETTLKERGKKW